MSVWTTRPEQSYGRPCDATASSAPTASTSPAATDRVVVKAEQALKQTPGASIITAEDIRKSPPATDVSEIIRTMLGVNLTGNSSSGQRGNNRCSESDQEFFLERGGDSHGFGVP